MSQIGPEMNLSIEMIYDHLLGEVWDIREEELGFTIKKKLRTRVERCCYVTYHGGGTGWYLVLGGLINPNVTAKLDYSKI